MKVVWILATILTGALGILAVLRSIERLVVRGLTGISPVQIILGAVFLLLAFTCLQRARRT